MLNKIIKADKVVPNGCEISMTFQTIMIIKFIKGSEKNNRYTNRPFMHCSLNVSRR